MPRHVKLNDIKNRLGPLWWYSLLIFFTQCLNNVINAVAGLWLVPHYVPQAELGAVQPLMQIGTMLGIPLGILITPYTKLLNTHAAHGEYGKVKALLRDAMILSAAASIITIAAAYLLMPRIFDFMRVQNGRLALLIVFSSIIGAITPIFAGAMQGLKRFRVYSFIGLFMAPIRFVTFLVALPFRGLTGYFVGQVSGPLFSIVVSIIDFLRKFGRQVKCESYWKEDRVLFLSFLIPMAAMSLTGNIKGTGEMMIVRSLPDVESAAFYFLSRFSDIASYLSAPLMFVLFPLVSEKHETGKDTHRMLMQTMLFTLGSGALLAGALMFGGKFIFSLNSIWTPYLPFAGLFGLMTITTTIRMACGCFTTHELACKRFGFARYVIPIDLVECLLVYTMLHNPGLFHFADWTLAQVLILMLAFPTITLVAAFIDLALAAKKRHLEAPVPAAS